MNTLEILFDSKELEYCVYDPIKKTRTGWIHLTHPYVSCTNFGQFDIRDNSSFFEFAKKTYSNVQKNRWVQFTMPLQSTLEDVKGVFLEKFPEYFI